MSALRPPRNARGNLLVLREASSILSALSALHRLNAPIVPLVDGIGYVPDALWPLAWKKRALSPRALTLSVDAGEEQLSACNWPRMWRGEGAMHILLMANLHFIFVGN